MKLGKTAGSQSQLLNSWDSLATGLTISWFYVVELETGVEKWSDVDELKFQGVASARRSKVWMEIEIWSDSKNH